MKLALTALAILALTSLGSAQVGSGIDNSPHDFSTTGWNSSRNNEICGVCHIPHVEGRAASQVNGVLLWGRTLSSASYTMYTSPTIQGTQDAAPTGSSMLCLGCHDGSVALEHFDNTTTGGAAFIATNLKVDPDMRNDHPVSIIYDDAVGNGLFLKTAAFGASGFTISQILQADKVQCSSCHDVHNKGDANASSLLRIQNDNATTPSALCLACHDK